MKLVLKETVENLGEAGDVITVKDGFGRNYLIPKGLALIANTGNLKMASERKKYATVRLSETLKNAKELAEKLNATSVTISVNANEDGKIFGTVTNANVAEALLEKGIEVDRRKISIENVKTLGEHAATIALVSDVKATVKVWVVKA
jgi:large subunit ribosomal protein L9